MWVRDLVTDEPRFVPGALLWEVAGVPLGTVEVEENRTIISIVGDGLRSTPGIAARVFSVISDINVSMISVGASSVNLTFMVDEPHAVEAIERLHRVCFESEIIEASGAKGVRVPTSVGP